MGTIYQLSRKDIEKEKWLKNFLFYHHKKLHDKSQLNKMSSLFFSGGFNTNLFNQNQTIGKIPESIRKTNLLDQIDKICQLKEVYYNDIRKEVNDVEKTVPQALMVFLLLVLNPLQTLITSVITPYPYYQQLHENEVFPKIVENCINMSNAKNVITNC